MKSRFKTVIYEIPPMVLSRLTFCSYDNLMKSTFSGIDHFYNWHCKDKTWPVKKYVKIGWSVLKQNGEQTLSWIFLEYTRFCEDIETPKYKLEYHTKKFRTEL